MIVGVPKEIKDHEYRVGLVPASIYELKHAGHRVLVERGAGDGSGIPDAEMTAAGAEIAETAAQVFETADMIVKVKEPQPQERKMLRAGQILFTYLHLAPDIAQTRDLVASKATCIAYETVTSDSGELPLLAPMSEVAGRLSPQVGATALQKKGGGRGVLLGGVPGVASGKVLVIGGGVAGTHAATIALGMGAQVTVLDRSPAALKRINTQFGGAVRAIYSTRIAIAEYLAESDLVIGTVLLPGASAPKLIDRKMLSLMKPGAVIVDVSIDQGGCCETSHATTHSDPTYIVDGIVHYCVANMPAAVSRTSTMALNNVTLPFVLALANKGWRKACLDDKHLRAGLNVTNGLVTCEPVALAHGMEFAKPETALC